MNRIVTILESILGAGTNRRSATFPTPKLTHGRLWPRHGGAIKRA